MVNKSFREKDRSASLGDNRRIFITFVVLKIVPFLKTIG